MKKHRRIFTVLIALILLISGIGISGAGAAEAAARWHPISGINTLENFNQIRRHDAKHPIWAHNSLGVVVTSKNPVFLADVQKACAAWAPAFKLHDYGYVNLARKKVDARKDKFPIVYVSQANTSWANDGKPGDRTLGAEEGTDFNNLSKHHYFKPSPIYIEIDTKAITYGFGSHSLVANNYVIYALEHEFGHAIGLRHSTDKNDLMYPVLNSGIKPADLAVVQRLYKNVSPIAYPKRLSFSNKNNFYLGKQNPQKLFASILTHFYVLNSEQQAVLFGLQFDNYHLYRKGHDYKHHRKLPNGSYHVRFTNMRMSISMKPQKKWQHYRLVLNDAVTGLIPGVPYVHYCHRFAVKPRRKNSTHKFSFTIKVRVKNHHFYVLK